MTTMEKENTNGTAKLAEEAKKTEGAKDVQASGDAKGQASSEEVRTGDHAPEGSSCAEETEANVQSVRISELEGLVTQAEDRFMRAKAEVENTRKRMEEQVKQAAKFSFTGFAGAMLEVRDALAAAVSGGNADNKDSLVEGVTLTLKKLDDAFEREEIKEIKAINQPFDPELHYAVSTQETSEVDPNTVVGVMITGYTISDRVLRPATVAVSRKPDGGNSADRASEEAETDNAEQGDGDDREKQS